MVGLYHSAFLGNERLRPPGRVPAQRASIINGRRPGEEERETFSGMKKENIKRQNPDVSGKGTFSPRPPPLARSSVLNSDRRVH